MRKCCVNGVGVCACTEIGRTRTRQARNRTNGALQIALLLFRTPVLGWHRCHPWTYLLQCHWSKYVHGWHRCQPRTGVRKSSSAICSAPLVLFLACLVLVLPISVQAQTPTPLTQHFLISAIAVAY